MRATVVGAFGSSVGYAVLLSTPLGRQFRIQYTWLSVVVGVALTIAWLYLVSRRAALLALGMFATTGTPIATMCVLEDMEKRRALWRFEGGR